MTHPGVVGVGYQGCTIDQLVAQLHNAGVARLVDVRLTPISRKPGFSKTALGHALAEAGITYEHRRELGNPKTNRAGFAGSPEELATARSVFARLLCRPESISALDTVAEAAQHELVALLCFEAEQHRCHRDVVLQEVRARPATALGSTRPAR